MKHHKEPQRHSKSPFLFLLVCAGFFLGLFLVQTGIALAAERIINFHTSIEVKQDSSLLITEEITYDFGDEERHGIYRSIPTIYDTDRGWRTTKLSVLSVLRDGDGEPYQTSHEGTATRIRIGSGDSTISGEHTYTFTYEVKSALNYFNRFDELYWNVTGNEWEVPIASTSARVALPTTPEDSVQLACYQGEEGSNESCTIAHAGAYIEANATRELFAGEGLTIAIGFPKGIVEEQAALLRDVLQILEYAATLLPLIVLVVMYRLWDAYGRDPKKGTIIAEYEPPRGVKPTMLGTIVDGRVDHRDIVSGLVYMAEQGYVHITMQEGGFLKKNDFELTLLKDLAHIPDSIEKDILSLLFVEAKHKVTPSAFITTLFGKKVENKQIGVSGTVMKLSELKQNNSAAQALAGIKKRAYAELVTNGYYHANPVTVMTKYLVGAGGIAIVAIVLGVLLGVWAGLGGFLSALIIAVYAFFMPQRTLEGAHLKDAILGFKEFLRVTDRDRFIFHNAPSNFTNRFNDRFKEKPYEESYKEKAREKSPQQFMEYLPFAISLGVEEEWAKQFEGMNIPEPSWYSGTSNSFTPALFASQMHSFASVAESSFAAAAPSGGSGSGGGGFSGGGMGGGGGGSW